jgi:hypothetical protein
MQCVLAAGIVVLLDVLHKSVAYKQPQQQQAAVAAATVAPGWTSVRSFVTGSAWAPIVVCIA